METLNFTGVEMLVEIEKSSRRVLFCADQRAEEEGKNFILGSDERRQKVSGERLARME
jgi:hypothetical protein